MKPYFFIYVLMLACLVSACNNDSTTTYSDASVVSFTFQIDTANLGPSNAEYKVIQRSDTGLIYNVDSLDFGSRLDSVLPYILFKYTPASAVIIFPDTTRTYTGSDTMNFTKKPIYLHTIASDQKHEHWYEIDLTVHTVDPYLYIWDQFSEHAYIAQSDEQMAFADASGLYLYVNNGFSTRLYYSSTGRGMWESKPNPTGLPSPCHVREILQYQNTLYYVDHDYFYTSTDKIHWQSTDYSSKPYTLITMLMVFDNQPWVVLQDRQTNQLFLGCVQKGEIVPSDSITGLDGNKLPATFPISEFASLPFFASSERPRSMVVGGRSMDGTPLNTRWNFEKDALTGYRVRNFTIEQPKMTTLTGMSIIQYDQTRLIMFGGMANDSAFNDNLLYSDDEGMNWYIPDSAENKMPETYTSRQKPCVVVDPQNYIYIIGGQTRTQTLSDVHRGYLISINWEK